MGLKIKQTNIHNQSKNMPEEGKKELKINIGKEKSCILWTIGPGKNRKRSASIQVTKQSIQAKQASTCTFAQIVHVVCMCLLRKTERKGKKEREKKT